MTEQLGSCVVQGKTEVFRQMPNYSTIEYAGRILWSLVHPLFRYSPRICFGWRRLLLRAFGARIGKRVRIYGSAHIYLPWMFSIGDDSAVGEHALIYCLGPVKIGNKVTISQRTHLCAGTHDYRNPSFPLIRSPITVEDDAWVCADAFVGPGVTVHQGAIVGARAAVFKDCDPFTIYGGNPARALKARDATTRYVTGNTAV